jgi:hypothetical protein
MAEKPANNAAMTIQLSREQARHLLARYHFTPTDLPGVFQRPSTVQYDPLNPVGRNPDLVLQARVPGYCVDDWMALTYQQRLACNSWDRSACLTPIENWPKRALICQQHHRITILGSCIMRSLRSQRSWPPLISADLSAP